MNVQHEVHLEHRWGTRTRCRARVRLSTSSGITGAGRIRDISLSGAFIETTAVVPVNARLALVVLGNESAARAVDMSATVVRVEAGGIGVEWCKTPACSICTVVGCADRCTGPDAK